MNWSSVYSVTNETAASAATYTLLKAVGPSEPDTDRPNAFVEFNGAGWIAKNSGLYRFDGADVVKVFPGQCLLLTAHQGALYWHTNGWLYRFNGSLVEKLQYFGNAEYIIDIQSHLDSLYVLTSTNATDYKFAGSDADGTIDNRIFEFDGANFRVIFEEDLVVPINMISSVGNYLVIATGSSVSAACSANLINFADRYKVTTSTSQTAYIITADFDGGLPNIPKLLRRIQVDVDNTSTTTRATIQYQRFIGSTWSDWSTAEPFSFSASTTAGTSTINIPTSSLVSTTNRSLFNRSRVKVTIDGTATGLSFALKGGTNQYN